MALIKNVNVDVTYHGIMDEIEKLRRVSPTLESTVVASFKVDNAYVKVLEVIGNKNCLTLTVGIFNNHSKELLIENRMYTFKPDVSSQSENFIKQGYDYLKSLPEFEGAIDVLEEGQTL